MNCPFCEIELNNTHYYSCDNKTCMYLMIIPRFTMDFDLNHYEIIDPIANIKILANSKYNETRIFFISPDNISFDNKNICFNTFIPMNISNPKLTINKIIKFRIFYLT